MTVDGIIVYRVRRERFVSRVTDEELREKYPAIMEAWERYQLLIKLHGNTNEKTN